MEIYAKKFKNNECQRVVCGSEWTQVYTDTLLQICTINMYVCDNILGIQVVYTVQGIELCPDVSNEE